MAGEPADGEDNGDLRQAVGLRQHRSDCFRHEANAEAAVSSRRVRFVLQSYCQRAMRTA